VSKLALPNQGAAVKSLDEGREVFQNVIIFQCSTKIILNIWSIFF